MAIITLRAYNREIEGMIDNGQLDEAVAHCRHILTTFPKHIATYRLLGKTHLEQQRISDATDIFQRVLSAIPDDFVSNVGMSIIREDENNLDASIWHMELAYEAQPSNTTIQDELRRLYGRRDGTQPPKVRLTRGALARMYAKGGLLDQAVAELNAAISEDPNRYDLQLLLAGMYFQTSQRVESVDTCINILKKLPFCLAANQILAVSLPEVEQTSAGKNYRQVAISMDPYFAYAAQDAITSDEVPENSVNIERLEWKSGIQMNDTAPQPTWATSLGVSLEKKPEEVLPDWLKGTESPAPEEPSEKVQPSVSPFIWDNQEVERIIQDESKPEGEIPDWMKDAGWKPVAADSVQKPIETINEPPIIEVQPQEDLEKAEIPEWLRGIAPEGVLEETQPSSQPMEKEVSLPWLEKQQPGPTDSIIQWLEDAKPETPVTPPTPEETSAEVSEEEVPDWLKDLDVAYPTADQGEQKVEESPAIPSATPAFIEGLVIAEAFKELETKEPPSDEQPGQVENIEPVPGFIETPATSEAIETEEMPAAFADELPDWIKELAGETPETTSSTISMEEPKVELPITEEQPGLEIPEFHEEMPLTEAATVGEEFPSVEEPSISAEEPTPVEPVIFEEQTQLEQAAIAESETGTEPSSPLIENPALAWLTGLTIQESLNNEEQVTPIEVQQATPPEWVKLEAEAITEETTPEVEPESEEQAAIPAEEIPDWLVGLGETSKIEEVPQEPVSAVSSEPLAPEAEEVPAWLIGTEIAKAVKETPEISQETLEKEEEFPDWIKEITETTPGEELPTLTEPAVTPTLPTLPVEPVSDWTPEETPVTKFSEVKSVELEPAESTWIPEVEAPTQPELVEPVEPEIEYAALPAEPAVLPVTEIKEAEINSLEDAHVALIQGQPSQAAAVYSRLIKQNYQLDEVIKDVQEALYRYPVDVNLWVTLGDAFLQTDELQDALNAYSKAEDLVR
jgi:tetratricopeptide (TPR) repeat protein